MSSDLPAVWQPRAFEGSDLLPVERFQGAAVDKIDMRGRESIELRDLIIPSLRILTGQSKPVQERQQGAELGLFHHSGVDKFYKPPLRVLVCAHTRSRALFPNPSDPRHKGLEACFSRNSVTGTVYGDCESCKHKNWGKDKGDKPACSESHNFTVLTPDGPAVLRLWKSSYNSAREFLTAWQVSPHPVWYHPAVITARSETKELPGGKKQPYFILDLRWDRRETVPPAAQDMAWTVHQQIKAAHEAGQFGFTGEDEDQQ